MGTEIAEGAKPAAEELNTEPAAVFTDAPAEVPLDYLMATSAPEVEVHATDGFDPATVTESPLSYLL